MRYVQQTELFPYKCTCASLWQGELRAGFAFFNLGVKIPKSAALRACMQENKVFAGAMTFGCVAWAKPLTARRRRRKKCHTDQFFFTLHFLCVILSSIDICLAFIFSISGRSYSFAFLLSISGCALTARLLLFSYQGVRSYFF